MKKPSWCGKHFKICRAVSELQNSSSHSNRTALYIRCVYQRQNELHDLYEYICTFISNFSSLCMAQQCRDDTKSKIFKLRSSMFIQTSKTTYVRHVQCVMNKLRYLLTTILNVSFDF